MNSSTNYLYKDFAISFYANVGKSYLCLCFNVLSYGVAYTTKINVASRLNVARSPT